MGSAFIVAGMWGVVVVLVRCVHTTCEGQDLRGGAPSGGVSGFLNIGVLRTPPAGHGGVVAVVAVGAAVAVGATAARPWVRPALGGAAPVAPAGGAAPEPPGAEPRARVAPASGRPR